MRSTINLGSFTFSYIISKNISKNIRVFLNKLGKFEQCSVKLIFELQRIERQY